MKRILLTLSAIIMTAATMTAQDSPLWLRRNDISPDGSKVAFTYKKMFGDFFNACNGA